MVLLALANASQRVPLAADRADVERSSALGRSVAQRVADDAGSLRSHPTTCTSSPILAHRPLIDARDMSSTGKSLDWRGYAIQKDESFDFTLQAFEPKKMNDLDVDIAIEACGSSLIEPRHWLTVPGVCSSDTHSIDGTWGKLNVLPLIPGHEAAGLVHAVGSKVTKFKVGDRAGVGAQVWSCGECAPCKSQNRNYCTSLPPVTRLTSQASRWSTRTTPSTRTARARPTAATLARSACARTGSSTCRTR